MNTLLTDDERRGKVTSTKTVYQTLRTEILNLAQRPGRLLDEATLADRFQMSRSPIREALIRLVGDGLAVVLPNRSTIVSPIELEAFPKYVEALGIAHRLNCRLAATNRTDEDLVMIAAANKELLETIATGDYLSVSAAHKNCNMATARAGRNPYLAAFYERLLDERRRMFNLHIEHLGQTHDANQLYQQHEMMLKAIRACEPDLADNLALEQTRHFRESFFEFMRSDQVSEVDLSKTVEGS
ncbi:MULTISPECIES: GntR family transcriptional regulator [unclassified Paraburkholderia]|uniref:GntR family transcriptional regulator n=1 Tax=unclassified Paraburkholderia TaxID=2615204 RepID=UPI00161C15A8|nr:MULTISPECIES: GntR family transcriptional regulator [unclassified Paraburkholderia]MBB5409018.1 DNA-binding GntR family transcriptional regulator [Paraburkholderia sp. HC6.4b]MBB5450746.1 DNA-binding GntR family transcriptional regulator [Paraburkholderia sp. Kb1A]